MTTHMVDASSPPVAARQVALRTKGHRQGPITRLMSPGDLGETLKPFVFLDYFDFGSTAGFEFNAHPHSGIATHTTFLEGAFEYGDSTGKIGSMGPGSVEWMQAGSGVWHWGRPLPGTPARGYQLWVALPPELELSPARSTYVDADQIASDGRASALLGDNGSDRSAVASEMPITYLHVRLTDGEEWTYRPQAHHELAWLAINAGRLHTASGDVLEQELVVFTAGNAPIELRSKGSSEFVIGSARKHGHTLVLGPSSVHTSEAALLQGHARIAELATTPLVSAARHA